MPDERGDRFPPWHGDMPGQVCDTFFGGLESERRRVMGDRKHYCELDHSRASYLAACFVLLGDCLLTLVKHRP